ncbi:hypothetical protein PUN28_003127 [Cardiocondyla obscurior]|uniref:Uncharacterized protein n=1 Tax=Cardiocondyla obscurior TaxID=286306 RepID=A0AAW2GIX8_9HYME
MRYIRVARGESEEQRCSSNLKIRPYHIVPSRINASSPNRCFPVFPLSSTCSLVRPRIFHAAVLHAETRQKNAIPTPAVVPSRDFPLFAKRRKREREKEKEREKEGGRERERDEERKPQRTLTNCHLQCNTRSVRTIIQCDAGWLASWASGENPYTERKMLGPQLN